MLQSSVRVTIDGREVEISRARLGLFLRLERVLVGMKKSIQASDSGSLVGSIQSYIEIAADERYQIDGRPWSDVYTLFIQLRRLNALEVDLPLLKAKAFSRNDNVPWDHPLRASILWIHIIAYNYGWSLTEIENLWPEDAAIYVQEILTEEQIRKEWEYLISSIAHPHDKKGRDLFKPLPRPSWMVRAKPRKQKIMRSVLPKGTIIDLSGVEVGDLDD